VGSCGLSPPLGLLTWDRTDIGQVYRDEDRRAKGEPGYTLGEFEKQQKAARRSRSGRPDWFEMRRSAKNTRSAKDRSNERVQGVDYKDYYGSRSASKMDWLRRLKSVMSTRT